MMLICTVAGEDYNGSHITVNVPSGVKIQSFTINITDSSIVKCNEKFNVVLLSVTTCGVTIGHNKITEVIIRDAKSKYVHTYVCR